MKRDLNLTCIRNKDRLRLTIWQLEGMQVKLVAGTQTRFCKKLIH